MLPLNKIRNLLLIVILVITISCKNSTTASLHSHGDGNHTHETTNYFKSYTLEDAQYGTKTVVTVAGNIREISTNALPNHETGTFPNEGNPNTIKPQNRSYSIPVTPKYTGKAQWVREPGVALNGVKFEPETAEAVLCESGERYRVEAKQNLIDMGLDKNNAHVQPTGAYHYHGTPTSMIEKFDTGQDLVHIGFAKDGFAIYYSKSGAYSPSFRLYDENREGEDCAYDRPGNHLDVSIENSKPDGTFVSDWEYVEGLGNLDECNGTEINGTYAYLVTDSYPYVPRCLMGEFEEEQHGPPPGQAAQRGERSSRGNQQQHDH
ncbi:YHYH protein [Christiangramia echinicola]|uniref:YHYH protein n=1 Tax=Christiangramia echinicola TaxID=279359 RepID=A0A1H1KZP6_9FLAO|nr:YHYH protein [Christiangramia echinicola]SDR67617.1 YHYH protein [Christiangramia echinicola]